MRILFIFLILGACQKINTEYCATAEKSQGEINIHLIVTPPCEASISIPSANINQKILLKKKEIGILMVNSLLNQDSDIFVTINGNTKKL